MCIQINKIESNLNISFNKIKFLARKLSLNIYVHNNSCGQLLCEIHSDRKLVPTKKSVSGLNVLSVNTWKTYKMKFYQ